MAQQSADVIIIGGGITGTSAAYQLALQGHSVILLEKGYIAAGGTGRTGGIIRQHYSNETTASMALRALKVWSDFDNVVGGDPGFRRYGALFAVGKSDLDGLKSNIALQQRVGINVQFLDPDGIREVAPYLNVDDLGGGAYEPDAGCADGAMAANAFAKRARELGATVLQGVEVTDVIAENGRVTGVNTTQGVFSAAVVVNAAGPWGTRIAKTVGYEVPVDASRHQIAVFQQPPDTLADGHPVVADFAQGFYFRPETGRLTLAGSIEASEAAHHVDPDHYVETVDMEFNADMAERTEHRVPLMGDARVGKGWAGLYDVSLDWHPILGRMPGLDGFICAFGWSGSGFKMGPVTGELIADLVTGEQRCPIDPHIFRFERFAEGALVRGQYNYSIIG
ncbi:MAG: FAD-binding oxidoreductase [Anaerolinea sp.]|nr:FAD-binding oxidoreductase [Anaerolinea sp.]